MTQSLYSTTKSLHQGPAILGESVLIDKETGRVLWEGGGTSSSLAAATATMAPKLSQLGFCHVRAMLLSVILFIGILGYLSRWIQSKIGAGGADASSQRSMLTTGILILLRWTLFLTPKFDRWFLVCIYTLYILESYTCR